MALENENPDMQTNESRAQDDARDAKRQGTAKRKDEAKTNKKRRLISILLLVMLLFGSASTFTAAVLNNQQGQAKKTPKTIYKMLEVDDLFDLIKIEGDEKEGYHYEFVDGTEEKLDALVTRLRKGEGTKAMTKDLLKKMIKAEVVNQLPFLKGAGTLLSASGDTIAEKVWNFLIEQGYSEVAVAGLMGNIHQESGGFNPAAVQNASSGAGIGLCQWSGDRRTKLENYAKKLGKDWSDVDVQLSFLVKEIEGGGFIGHKNEWKNAETPQDAAIAFEKGFERAGKPMMGNRTHWAQVYYNRYRGTFTASTTQEDSTETGELSGTVRIRRVTPNKNIGEVKNTGSGSVTDTTTNTNNATSAQIENYIKNNVTAGTWSVYAKNLTSNTIKADVNNQKLKAEGLINLFIMATAFEKIETGELSENEVISDINSMIARNDNSAADRIIDKINLGSVSSYITTNGYKATEIRKKVSEGKDDNFTSATDVGNLLEKMYRGTCVSKNASQKMIEILKKQTAKNKIPGGVPSGVETANKTGEAEKIESDAAIVYKDNANYVVVIVGNDIEDTTKAKEDIPKISSEIYNMINLTSASQGGNNSNASHKVAIVAGHGTTNHAGSYTDIANRTKWYTTGTSGKTPSGETWKEWQITKKVADYVEKFLYPYSSQVSVVQVGYSKPNWERVQLAKDQGVDSYIGIHFNSSSDKSANGVNAYYRNGDSTSKNFANIFVRNVSEKMGLQNKGVMSDSTSNNGKLDSIGNASECGFPSTLIEGGFMSNSGDMDVIGAKDEAGLKKYAQGIAAGVLEYYGIENTGIGEDSFDGVEVTNSTTTTTTGVDSKIYDLKYVPQDVFDSYIESKDEYTKRKALYSYTLDKETNKLIVANWSYSTEDGIEIIPSEPINYRSVLNKYTMPIEYMIDFLIHTDDAEMVGKLADLAIDTEYIIAVQDNVTTVETTVDIQEKNYRLTRMDTDEYVVHQDHYQDWHTTSKTVTVKETVSNEIELTYADSWFVRFSKTMSYASIALNQSAGNNLTADQGAFIGDFKTTVYCAQCNSPSGSLATASGAKARPNHTIAVHLDYYRGNAVGGKLAKGSQVLINGQVYTVEDTGDLSGRWPDNWIDIFCDSPCEKHAGELDSGKGTVPVYAADYVREAKDENSENESDVETENKNLKGINTTAGVDGEVNDTTTVMQETLGTIYEKVNEGTTDVTERKKITTVRTISNKYDSGIENIVKKDQDFIDVFLSSKGILRRFNMGWMETLLAQNERTVNMIDLTKYLYNQAKAYEQNKESSESYNFDVYKRNDLYSIYSSSSILEEFIKAIENNPLRLYMSNHASIDEGEIEKYITTNADEPKYKILTNEENGKGFGFNIFHRLNETDWNTGGSYDQRIVEHYKELGIKIKEDKYNNEDALLETSTVDQVMRKEIQKWKDLIEEEMKRIGIDLPDNRIDALTIIAYKYGWSKQDTENFQRAYQTYYVAEKETEFQKQFSIAQGTIKPFYILPNAEAISEKEKKERLKTQLIWNLFDQGEYKTPEGEVLDPDSFNSIGSGELLGVAEECWKKVCEANPNYGGAQRIPWDGSQPNIDCSAYISWVLYEYGKATGDDALVKEFEGGQHDTSALLTVNWESLGFEVISISQGQNIMDLLQPGDIIVRRGGGTHHTNITVEIKNGKVYSYDCGNAGNWRGSGGKAIDRTYFTKVSAPGLIVRKK